MEQVSVGYLPHPTLDVSVGNIQLGFEVRQRVRTVLPNMVPVTNTTDTGEMRPHGDCSMYIVGETLLLTTDDRGV